MLAGAKINPVMARHSRLRFEELPAQGQYLAAQKIVHSQRRGQ
jgi:hypothetical protein